MLNDNVTKVTNPPNNISSNFNSVTEYHGKPLVDEKTDDSFPEKVCFNKQELIPGVIVKQSVSAVVIPESVAVKLKPVCEAMMQYQRW